MPEAAEAGPAEYSTPTWWELRLSGPPVDRAWLSPVKWAVFRPEVVGKLAWIATLAGATGSALHFSPMWLHTVAPWLFPLVVLAASGAPYLMSSALAGAAMFVLLRHWIGAGVAIAVFAGAFWTQASLYIGRPVDGSGRTVVAMQANLLFGGADPAALVDEVRARNIDVLTVDELTPVAVDRLGRAGLDHRLPYRYLRPAEAAGGTGIWSRYPLSETVDYDGFVFHQISATADIPSLGPVAVYAFHPVPPIVRGAQVWADELTRLGRILDQAPPGRPAIVGGDFNATHDHTQFRALASGRFGNATAQTGAGHLATYPTGTWLTPLIGIDHILTAEACAITAEAVDLPGSDHRAVVARLRLGHEC